MDAETTTSTLEWTAHPARRRPGAAVAAVVLIAAISGAAYVGFHSPGWAIFAVVVLILSLQRFFFPSRYAIDEDGISAAYFLGSKHLRWSEVRRFRHDRYGAFLSSRARPSWTDAWRGMLILFDGREDEVLEAIRSRLPHQSNQSNQ